MSRKIFGHEIQHRTRIHKDLRHTVYSDFLTVLTRHHVDTADGVEKLLTAEESSGKARPIPIAVGRATCVASTRQESTTSSTKLTDRFSFPFPFAGLVRSCTSWRATEPVQKDPPRSYLRPQCPAKTRQNRILACRPASGSHQQVLVLSHNFGLTTRFLNGLS
jgi:hypothetical protein